MSATTMPTDGVTGGSPPLLGPPPKRKRPASQAGREDKNKNLVYRDTTAPRNAPQHRGRDARLDRIMQSLFSRAMERASPVMLRRMARLHASRSEERVAELETALDLL
jgi:hypothetical protein